MRFVDFLSYAILLICPLGALMDIAYPSVFGQTVYVYFLIPIFIIYLSILILNKYCIRFNKLDLWLVIFFCYLSTKILDAAQVNYFMALLLAYLVGKLSGKRSLKIAIILMLISSLLQIIVGELQILDVLDSPNTMFKVSGTFFNPAPYAGFLVMIIPFCYYYKYDFFEGKRSSLFRVMVYIVILGSLILLFSADSRAALFAFIVSLVYLYWNDDIVKGFRSKLFANKSYIVLFFLSIIFIFSFVYLYKYKSANGRLFIWMNSLNGIHESPILGRGLGSFKQYYMLLQKNYFADNFSDKYSSIADNVEYMYNSLLLVLFELGFVGLLLVCVVLYYIFAPKFKSKLSKPLKASCLSVLVFSFFSYPSEIPAICIYMFFILGLISSVEAHYSVILVPALKKPLVYIVSFVFMVVALFHFNYCLKIYATFKKWNVAMLYYDRGDFSRSKILYDEIYAASYLNNNPIFLDHYAKVLFLTDDFQISDLVSKQVLKIRPNVGNYLLYAQSLARQGKYEFAEKFYIDAVFMVPKMFYGEYLLCKMYRESGNDVKFNKRANQFLYRSSDSDQLIVKEMRDSVNKWLRK